MDRFFLNRDSATLFPTLAALQINAVQQETSQSFSRHFIAKAFDFWNRIKTSDVSNNLNMNKDLQNM